MTYYNGDINKLLINFYKFISTLGYDITIDGDGDDIKVTCKEFAGDDKYGTGPWIYTISNYVYCDDIKDFTRAIKYTRIQNDNGRELVSHIYQYDGNKVFWKRLKIKEEQWLECVLSCLMPGRAFNKILDRFESSDVDGLGIILININHWFVILS